MLHRLKRALKHFKREFRKPTPQEQEIKRLQSLGGQSGASGILGPNLRFLEADIFLHMRNDVFLSNKFKFESKREDPKIIDCGANIGVTIAYWKHMYPKSTVLGIEASPQVFGVLSDNWSHDESITLINAAVSDNEGCMHFSENLVNSLGGRLVDGSFGSTVEVRCRKLSEFIKEPVDFIKMDIEGAEIEVLRECSQLLGNVDKMFIEYHSFSGQPQHLAEFFGILESAGFRLHIHHEMPAPMPFLETPIFNGKDLRLNVYCFR